MLEVEPPGQCGCMAIGSGRNGNEAVVGAASEAFARRLHHRYASVNSYMSTLTLDIERSPL